MNDIPMIAIPPAAATRRKTVDVDQFCNNALQFHRVGVTVPMLVEHYLGLAADVKAVGLPAKRAIEKRLAEIVEIGVAIRRNDRYFWWRNA